MAGLFEAVADIHWYTAWGTKVPIGLILHRESCNITSSGAMSLCDAITNLLQQVIWALFLKKAPPCFFFLAGRHPAGVRGGPLQSATVENPGGAKKKILKPMAWFLQFGKHNSLFVLKKMDLTMNFNVMLWALIVLTCIK